MAAQAPTDGAHRRPGLTLARGRLVPLVVGALLAADLALIAAHLDTSKNRLLAALGP